MSSNRLYDRISRDPALGELRDGQTRLFLMRADAFMDARGQGHWGLVKQLSPAASLPRGAWPAGWLPPALVPQGQACWSGGTVPPGKLPPLGGFPTGFV